MATIWSHHARNLALLTIWTFPLLRPACLLCQNNLLLLVVAEVGAMKLWHLMESLSSYVLITTISWKLSSTTALLPSLFLFRAAVILLQWHRPVSYSWFEISIIIFFKINYQKQFRNFSLSSFYYFEFKIASNLIVINFECVSLDGVDVDVACRYNNNQLFRVHDNCINVYGSTDYQGDCWCRPDYYSNNGRPDCEQCDVGASNIAIGNITDANWLLILTQHVQN